MKLDEIKNAVLCGKKVYWSNELYSVETYNNFDDIQYFYIVCISNGNCIGLTHKDGITLNGKESDFFIKMGNNS